MTGELVLLTGGTGHIGYRTIIEALRKGYKVRAAIRRESSITELKATKSIQPYLNNIDFVIVEDITKDGAFDEAVKGVDYVVHIASPLAKPSDDLEATIIQPAIHGTVSILYSALKAPSIKKVVITASQASVTPPEAWTPGFEGVVTPAHKVADPSGPYSSYFGAYAASKVLAYNRTLEFEKKENPKFAIINVMPSFVVGKNELATTKTLVNSGSNGLALHNILGINNPAGLTATTVHVDDVAFVHIAALDPGIEGNRNFACNSQGLDGIVWDDALDIVRKNFPKEVEAGIFPLSGSQRSNKLKYDASKTEEELKFKFKSFEKQILSLAGWYAEVA